MLDFSVEFLICRRLTRFQVAVDGAFRDFSRANGEAIEKFFDPLLWFLIWLEKLLLATPWPIILLLVAGLAYLGSRSWKLAVGSIISFTLIGYFGMWEDTMSPSRLFQWRCLMCGDWHAAWIWMAKSDRAQSVIAYS